ncbi:hypothetical protein OROGR_002897 [Orobanche gracilis]
MISNDNMINDERFNYSHDHYYIHDGLVRKPNCLTNLLPPLPSPETFFISPETILPADYRFPSSCGSRECAEKRNNCRWGLVLAEHCRQA